MSRGRFEDRWKFCYPLRVLSGLSSSCWVQRMELELARYSEPELLLEVRLQQQAERHPVPLWLLRHARAVAHTASTDTFW